MSRYTNNLRIIRESKGMSQGELGAKLNTTGGNVSLWELGKREIPSHHLLPLSELTGKSIEYILGKETKVPYIGYTSGVEEFHEYSDKEENQSGPLPLVSNNIPANELGIIKVTGESMRPFMKEGWNIYALTKKLHPEDCIKNLCLVKLKDGRSFIKEIYKGSEPNKYNLVSYSNFHSPIENVEIEYVYATVSFQQPTK